MAFVERDRLPFLQFLESTSFQIAHVEEDVIAVSGVNESKTFFRQLLNRAFSHSSTFFNQRLTKPPAPDIFEPNKSDGLRQLGS